MEAVLKHEDIIEAKAKAHGLDAALVAAVIEVESAGDPFAVRYEPNFKYVRVGDAKPGACSTQTELNIQRTSWGLMQVMGSTARDFGLTGWITTLVEPELGIEFGCRVLAKKVGLFGEAQGLGAYNAGIPLVLPTGRLKNQPYVDKVLAAKERYRKEFPESKKSGGKGKKLGVRKKDGE